MSEYRHYNSRLPLLSETWKSFPHWTLDEENQSVATSFSDQLDPPPYRPIALEVLKDARPAHELVRQFLTTPNGQPWETNLSFPVLRFLSSRFTFLAGVPKAHRLVLRQLSLDAMDVSLYGRYPFATIRTAIDNLTKVEGAAGRAKTFFRALGFIRKERGYAEMSPTLNLLAAVMYSLPTRAARERREALYCIIDLLMWLCAETDTLSPSRSVIRDVRATRRAHRTLILSDGDVKKEPAVVPGWRKVTAASFALGAADTSVLLENLAAKPFSASKFAYNGSRGNHPITPLEMALLAYDFGEQRFHPPLINEVAALVSVMEPREGQYARSEFARSVFRQHLHVTEDQGVSGLGVMRRSRISPKQRADIRREQASVLRGAVPPGSALLWVSLITDTEWGRLQYSPSGDFATSDGGTSDPYLIQLLAAHCTFEQAAECIDTVLYKPNALALVAAKLVSGIDTDLATEMFG